MGSDVTPSDKRPLAGVLIPHSFATSAAQLAEDYDEGTDYHHLADALGHPTSDADRAPRLRLIASGTPGGTAKQREVQVARGGGLGPGGVGVVVRPDSGSNWMGRDRESSCTGYSIVRNATGALDRCLVPLSDGTVRAFYVTITSSVATIESQLMATDGSWSADAGIRASYTNGYTWAGFCVIADPTAGDDDTYLMYTQWESAAAGTTIACLRSTDKGLTWKLQTANCLPAAVTTTAGIRTIRAAARAGQVVLCFTVEAGASSETGQYLSADGGYTFEEIAPLEGDATVWDIIATPVGFVVSFTAEVASVVYHYAHTTASGRDLLIDPVNGTQLQNSGATGLVTDQYGGSALALLDSGRVVLHAMGTNNAGTGVAGDVHHLYSDDYGSTWTLGFVEDWGATLGPGWPSMARHRGRLLRIEDGYTFGANTFAGRTYLTAWGGISDVTTTQDVPSTTLVHYPSKLLTANGFVDSGTGSPTNALHVSYGYETITCGAGDTSILSRTYNSVSGQTLGAVRAVLEVTAGTFSLIGDAGALSVRVDVTSTQIRAYELGGTAPSYTTHNIAGFLDIIVISSPNEGDFWVGYREWDETTERAYTQLTVVTSAVGGPGTSIVQLRSAVSTTTKVKLITAGSAPGASGGLLSGGLTRPDDLDPIELSPSRSTYIGDGISVIGQGGPGVRDEATYTIPITSDHPKEYVLPQVQPSPARPAKFTNAAQTLRFTMEPDNGSTGTYAGGQLLGVYLGGLYGVGQVSVYDTKSGSIVGSTVDLRLSFDYQLAGNVLRVDRASADSEGRYIREGELVGWTFEDDGGEVRTVLANTEGTLQAGPTVDTKRCTITLDAIDGTETATGAGKLYPKRALVLVYMHGATTFEQLRLVLAAHTGHAHKEVGTLAAGWVHILGRGVDRNHSLSIQDGTTLTTYPDGSRTAAARAGARRRLEVAFVDSHVDLSDVWSSDSPSPDYVVITDNTSAEPMATRFGTPITAQGIWERAEGSRNPVVMLPAIPHNTASSTRVLGYTLRDLEGVIYGRIVSPFRRTRVPFGVHHRTDGYRTSTIAIEEEL